MTTSPSRGRDGIVYYYECKKKDCGKLRIGADKAHKQFKQILLNIQPTERVIKLFENMVLKEWDKVINQSKLDADKLESRIQRLKNDLQSVRKARDEEIYTAEEAVEEADNIRQEIRILEIEKSDIKIEQYDTEIIKDFTNLFLKNLGSLLGTIKFD